MRWWLASWLWIATLASAAPLDSAVLDAKLRNSLRELHNLGADQYNAGDAPACYHTYRGALLAVKPLLDYRPTVQTLIDDGLAAAEQAPNIARKAYDLHLLIEKVRTELKPAKPAPPVPPPLKPTPPSAPAPPEVAPVPRELELAPPPKPIERVAVPPQPVERIPAPRSVP
jgi:hypothetical protein